MKTKIILSLMGLLFISGAFGEGCEEEEEPKPDYIIVNVTTKGHLYHRLAGSPAYSCGDWTRNEAVRIDVIKAGGERFNLYSTTNFNCEFATETVSFKLYREQPIEVQAYTESVPNEHTLQRGIDYLSWDEVYPTKDFGETYNYAPEVNVFWLYTN